MKKVKTEIVPNADQEIYSNIFEYAKMSLKLEQKREESLISQSNRMMTAFSITTGILFVVYEKVNNTNIISAAFLNTITIICLLLFVASMILALCVSWRYKYRSLSAPVEMMNHILANEQYFRSPEQRNKSFTETIDEVWKSLHLINDKRANLIMASMIVYFISLGIVVLSTFFIIIDKIL